MSAAAARQIENVLAPYVNESVRVASKAFNRASEEAGPACLGDRRFTADTPRRKKRADPLIGICTGCPLFDYCDALAGAMEPETGFWAGTWYVKGKRRPAS